MAGPANRSTLSTYVPAGEAQRIFAPADAAQRIENLEITPEGTLRTVLGPCHYEPSRPLLGYPTAYTDRPHGLFHAGLLGGIADTLVARFGTRLYLHRGESRSFSSIVTGLSSEARPSWPDQFLTLHDRIIW